MTPEERQLLIQTHRLVEENNTLLRKMHRAAIMGRAFRLVYWIAIIGLSVGAYYFIQPYVEQVQDVFGNLKDGVASVKDAASNLGDIGKLFEGIGK